MTAGIKEIQDSTIKHITRKLKAEFKEALHIFPDEKGKFLVFLIWKRKT